MHNLTHCVETVQESIGKRKEGDLWLAGDCLTHDPLHEKSFVLLQ